MAWTAPRTWVTSEIVTATLMNTHVRDNLLETAPAKATIKGDMFVATAANTVSRLGIGTNGQILVPNSGCNAGVQWTSQMIANLSSGSRRITASSDHGQIHIGEDVISSSNLSIVFFGASGKGSYIRFVEQGVDNRWLIGTDAGSSFLNFATGFPGASNARMVLQNDGRLQLNTITNAGSIGDFEIRRSGVAHGVTLFGFDTSAYGVHSPYDSGVGGYSVWGLSEQYVGIDLGGTATLADTARATTANAAVVARASLKSGIGITTMSANSNLFAITNYTTARFLFDADGDMHADAAVSASAYDLWDDPQLARALMLEIGGRNIVRDEFDGFLRYNRKHLQDLGIATFNDGPGEDGSVFVNWTQMSRVLAGAAWQLSACIMRIERQYATAIDTLTDRVDRMSRTLASGSGLQQWGTA